eukprot:COSAG04_NODE_1805_length_5534_cov_3.875989_2_plen_1004_part_00
MEAPSSRRRLGALRNHVAAAPSSSKGTLLVVNRGEIAIRICRAAAQLGIKTVAVYSTDDAACLHTKKADVAVELSGAGFGAAAYLNQEAILAVAKEQGATLVHCGYGFLSENAEFAAAVEAAGLTLVGPPSAAIELFGDKTKARELAEAVGVALLPGTTAAVSVGEAKAFMESLGGKPIMIKALAGGGGRGMRPVLSLDELEDAYERCQSEAAAAFGNGDVFVEQLMIRPRHIEVQVLADGQGGVTHLFERECSIQRQNQKIVEIAPSPSLPPSLRARILDDAIKLVAAADYRSAATVEFLVEREMNEDSAYAFMEVNPRLQVEHTITEEILDKDIVQLQLGIAAGATLSELGLTDVGEPSGFAIQCRINMETMLPDGSSAPTGGTLTTYEEPGGRGVRVDSMGYAGYATSSSFDSLLAKIICHSSSGYDDAIKRSYQALCEFNLAGVETNIRFVQNILCDEAFQAGDLHTGFIADNIEALLADDEHSQLHFEGDQAADNAAGAGLFDHEFAAAMGPGVITTALTGTIVSLLAQVGDRLSAGQPLGVISAMKMESTITAERSGTLTAWDVVEGQAVQANSQIGTMEPDDEEDAEVGTQLDVATETIGDGDWSNIINGIHERRAAVAEHGRQPRYDRDGNLMDALTITERCQRLLDADTFRPIGIMSGKSVYDEDGNMITYTPANFTLAHGKINGRPVVVGGEDFTIAGGSPNSGGLKKSVATEKEALRFRCPLVRLHEGGGGSVGGNKKADVRDTNARLVDEKEKKDAPGGVSASPTASVASDEPAKDKMNFGGPTGRPPKNSMTHGDGGNVFADNRFSSVGEVLAAVPVATAAMGAVAGLPASRLVASHFTVMTPEAQVMVAGPRVVERAWEGTVKQGLTKQELGGPQVQLYNGVSCAIIAEICVAFSRNLSDNLADSVSTITPWMRTMRCARSASSCRSCRRMCGSCRSAGRRATRRSGRSRSSRASSRTRTSCRTTCAASSSWCSTRTRGLRLAHTGEGP